MVPGNSFADDFQMETKCDGTNLIITIKNDEGSLLANAKILTITSLTGTGGYEKKYFSNEKGEITIPQGENTGYIWLQKGGFNDIKSKVQHCRVYENTDTESNLETIRLPDLGFDTIGLVSHPIRDKLFACIESDFSKKIVTARQFEDERAIMYSAMTGLYHGVAEDMSELKWTQYLKEITRIHCPQMLSVFDAETTSNGMSIIEKQCFTDWNGKRTCKNVEEFREIPGWIKTNAAWWADGQVNDETFVNGIQFILKEKIIDIPNLPKQVTQNTDEGVPEWIKTNAKWWSEGQIDDNAFFKGIEFLVSKGIIRVDNEIVPVKENKVTKVTNLEDIRPRPSSFGEWDRQRIVENTQAPENALDNIRMWYEKNGSLVQVYIFEFNTKSQANEYYSAYVNLADSTYYSANIDPISYTVSPSYSEEVCFDDQIVMPNGYPVGIRFSYVTGIVCESNNIVFHVYHQKDNLNEEDFDIYSAQQILTKINQKLGYEEPEVQITYLGSALPSNESYQVQDSGTSGDSFEIDVVSCEPTSGGHYIEVAYGIKNNLPDDYQLDLQILLLDNNGDVIEIKRTYADTKAGRTIYDDRLLDYDPRTVQCFIEIVDGFVPYN